MHIPGNTWVFHLPKITNYKGKSLSKKQLPDEISNLLMREDIVFVGKRVRQDVQGILKSYITSANLSQVNLVELDQLITDYGASKFGRPVSHVSLQAMVEVFLQKYLAKEDSIRKSQNWFNPIRALSKEQVDYAGNDAEASLLLYQHIISNYRNQSIPVSANSIEVGLKVILLSDIAGRNNYKTSTIASGEVVKIFDSESTNVKWQKIHNITKSRAIISVSETNLFQKALHMKYSTSGNV